MRQYSGLLLLGYNCFFTLNRELYRDSRQEPWTDAVEERKCLCIQADHMEQTENDTHEVRERRREE